MDKFNKLLGDIEQVFQQDDNEGEGHLRASNAGYEPRYLAHDLSGTPHDSLRGRSSLVLEAGNVYHDVIRDRMSESTSFNVLSREQEVELDLGLPVPVLGHVDLILEDIENDWKILIDIKTSSRFGYVKCDPKNKKSKLYWSATNFMFDPIKEYKDDPFKSRHLSQLALYYHSPLEFDDAAILMVCRDTGHMALGPIKDVGHMHKLYQETMKKFKKVYANPEPYSFDPCYKPNWEKDKLDIRCEYCPYTTSCWEVEMVGVKGGKPKIKVFDQIMKDIQRDVD